MRHYEYGGVLPKNALNQLDRHYNHQHLMSIVRAPMARARLGKIAAAGCVVKAAVTIGVAWWLAGCGPNQGAQFDSNRYVNETKVIFDGCVKAINAKPEYGILLPHTVIGGNPTISQMTDETLPTRQEAALYGQRADEVIGECVPPLRQAVATYQPLLYDASERYLDKIRATVVLTVERKLTWAERLRRNQAALAENRQENASINQAQNVQMAQDQNQRAQNAAATLNALAAVQNANRPYIPPPPTFVPAPVAPVYQAPQPIRIQPFSCTRLGAFVNCQ
jgi:hypothetical protein